MADLTIEQAREYERRAFCLFLESRRLDQLSRELGLMYRGYESTFKGITAEHRALVDRARMSSGAAAELGLLRDSLLVKSVELRQEASELASKIAYTTELAKRFYSRMADFDKKNSAEVGLSPAE